MRSLRDDRGGGLLGLAALLIALIVLAYAFSVLFPQEWSRFIDLAAQTWSALRALLERAWDAISGWLSRYFDLSL